MKKGALPHYAFSFTLLGLMLSASPSQAQSKLEGLRRFHHRASTRAQTTTRATGDVPPASVTYSFTLLNFPGAPNTFPSGINSGATSSPERIVGGYGPNPVQAGLNGFLLDVAQDKGAFIETFQTVNFPGESNQSAYGVNDSGQIVGIYGNGELVNSGYELSGGKYTTINVPFSGATATFAIGINDAGVIAGAWGLADEVTHGFQLSGGVFTQLDYPGASSTFASGINNSGDIVGYYDDTAGTHGFLLSGGTYTSIDVPGAIETIASGINDAGDVVGFYCTTSACLPDLVGGLGFLLSGGTYSTIHVPGASGTVPSQVSNSGKIVGAYLDCAGDDHGFVATP
jgi:hypothetical protein